jgi:acyl-coenzyme A synthetase/AMP-(fatty) acid ligase
MVEQTPQPYPYTKTWEEAKKDPIVILHTSGSTGNPKPITYNHAFLNTFDSSRLFPRVNGQRTTDGSILQQEEGSQFYLGFPFFHLGAMGMYFLPIWYNVVLVLGSIDVPASGKVFVDVLKEVKLQGWATPPSLAEDVVKEYQEEFLKYAKDLRVMFFGGGMCHILPLG